MNAIDTPEEVVGKIHQLLAAGYHGIIRYTSPNTHTFPTKQISAREAQQIHAVPGMKIGLVYEMRADHVGYFTPQQGQDDGAAALEHVSLLSVPTEVPVFFAVDFDASTDNICGPVLEYFQAVHTRFSGASRLVGVYGSGHSCETLKSEGVVHFTWLAQSRGWSGYQRWKPKADIVQGPATMIAGISLDTDFVLNESVLW